MTDGDAESKQSDVANPTRRQFLKETAIKAAKIGFIASLPTWLHQSNRPMEAPKPLNDEGSLKSEIEAEFGVRLAATGRFSPTEQGDSEARWNRENLSMLKQILPLLPEKFRRPNAKGEKPLINIIHGRVGDCGCGAGFPDDYRINIGDKFFDSVEDLLPPTSHEFVHLTTPRDTSKGLFSAEFWQSSAYYPEVEKIFGQSFSEIQRNLAEDALNKAALINPAAKVMGAEGFYYSPLINSVDPETKKKLEFYANMEYWVKNSPAAKLHSPEEFVAGLGQFYVFGYAQFKQFYQEFFSEQQTEDFYQFTKDKIFEGLEYDNLKPIRP
jgi:hypothetical protein